MNLTTEQLKELENLSALFFSIHDIMIALDIPLHNEMDFTEQLSTESGSPEFIAYNRGRLTASIELRQSIKTAALNGSNPAQTTLIDFYNQSQP